MYGKYFNTFKINQITFTYGEGKMEQPNFYGMFSQFRFQRNIEDNTTTIQRNQSAHTAKAEPILELIWSKRLLFGHFRTKNKFASQNRLVRLPPHSIGKQIPSPKYNLWFSLFSLYPRTVCIIIYRAVILDFMGSSAFLNDQTRVNRKFILNLSQNSQIYPSSRKSVQQNT